MSFRFPFVCSESTQKQFFQNQGTLSGWKDAILEVLKHINANDELIQIAKSEESIENIKDRFIEKEFILDVVEVFR